MSQEQEQVKEPRTGSPPEAPATLPLVDETESVLSGDNNNTASAAGGYKYRDFSTVNEDDDDAVGAPEGNPVPSPSRNTMETSIRVQKFPVKLYAILAQKEFNDIIAWMPHGRSWKVLKPNVFESLVMPLFFEYSNYHSFNRLVNAWSFRRMSSGPDRGSYYHELFLRGKPHLQKYMRRLPKTHKKLPMRKQDEPDFYRLDKTNPLPAIEDAPVPGGLSASNAMRGGLPMTGGMPGMAGMPPGMASAMGIPTGGFPPSMQGRMLPSSAVGHAPQARFPQGGFGMDPLQGQEDFGDMGGGASGMMGRGMMPSGGGAFRSPMHAGQMSPGMGMSGTSPGRMAQSMGGRGMPSQMYSSGMSGQLMNPMPGGGATNRMNAGAMRRFRPMMDGGMPNEQSVSAFSPEGMQGGGQDEFYARQQPPMRRLPMDQMASMQQMYGDRAAMAEQLQTPYGDVPGGKSEMYGGNFRDIQSGGNDFMYRGGEGGPVMPQIGGSEDYMGMVPMRRQQSQQQQQRPPM